MDDSADRGYSRAPELEDLVALCRALNEAGARYVLIGGFAVILHGYVRGTRDIDLLVAGDSGNFAAVKSALATLPDNAVAELTEGDLARYAVVRVADEIVVDLLVKACDVDYGAASESAQQIVVEGVSIPVASKEVLVRTKNTVRPSDAEDVRFLRLLIEEEQAD